MSTTSNSLLEAISHYQRNIERSQNSERGPDTKRILHCIEKLYKLPINVEHLQETGIGKTINGLRKYDGEVGVAAKALVTKWKRMVATQECEEHINNNDNNNGNKSDEDDFNNDSNFNDVNPKSQHNHRSDKNNSSNSDNNNKNTNKSSSTNHLSHKEREREKGNEKYSKQSPDNLICGRKNDLVNDNDMIVDTDDDEEKLVIVEQLSSSSHNKSAIKKGDDQKSKTSKNEATHRKKHSVSEHHKESSKKDKNYLKYESSSGSKDRKEYSSKQKNSSDDKHKMSLSSDEKTPLSTKRHLSSRRLSDDKKDKIISRGSSEDSLSNDKKNDSDNRHHNTISKSRSDAKDKSRDKKSDARHENEKHSKSDNDKKCSDNDKKHSHSDKSKVTKHHKSKKEKNNTNKRRSSNDDEHSNNKLKNKVPKLIKEVEIDSTTGTSFEEALGMIMPAQKIKNTSKSSPISSKASPKKSSAVKVTSSRSSSSSNDVVRNTNSKISRPDEPSINDKSQTPPLLTSTADLKPLDLNILSDLGTVSISNNYKPMPLNPTIMECVFKPVAAVIPRPRLTDDEALQHGISSKTIRTKVYSGIKTGKLFQTPSLFDICIRVLQRNIDCLEYTGGVPFDILKPILERASPLQLSIIEEYNPYLLEDSDCLWEYHAHRNYRGHHREEMESYREMFFRCKEEQESKLDALTKKVKNSQTVVALPVRKTQLAYIDSMVKPPRNILRKQEQFGTSKKLVATPAARVAALNSATPNATKIGDVRLRVAAHERDTAQATVHQRPKKAPLMAKSLLLFKGRRR